MSLNLPHFVLVRLAQSSRNLAKPLGVTIAHVRILSWLTGELVGDPPEPLGVVAVECVGGDASGMVGALSYRCRLAAVFVIAAGDALDVGAGRQQNRRCGIRKLGRWTCTTRSCTYPITVRWWLLITPTRVHHPRKACAPTG